MTKILDRLITQKKCSPPSWLSDNTMYLCQMGSVAYGVSTDNSDVDVYGFCMPPKRMLAKPFNDHVPGFDKYEEFNQWQEHHIKDATYGKEYDFSVYNITRYFRLLMENNPNIIDSLFVPRNCVLHSTTISELIRENRNIFLHKGCWHKFKGYAFSQMHKMDIKVPKEDSKRYADYERHGYSTKFAYHIVRLLNEVEQILVTGTLDLQQNREQLKAIRRGEWYKDEVVRYFKEKEKHLEEVYLKSELPKYPDEAKIRKLLVECIEMHYDMSSFRTFNGDAEKKLAEIQAILDK